MKLRALLLVLTCCLAVLVTVSASAQAPQFNGCGVVKKDSDSDAGGDPAAEQTGGLPDEVEMEGAWIQYDAAKGADATTVNLQIKNLSGSVPPPATSITYTATYGGVTDGTNFVRAHVDWAGMVVFEYGHLEPLATTTRYAYDGPTRGELFTGEHGVAQIVVPAEAGGKDGQNLRGITALTQHGRTTAVPGAISQSPSRGLSYQVDDVGLGSFTVGPCAAGGEPPAGGTPPGGTPPSTSDEPLPVRLATKSVKRAKAKKTIRVKLSSSEPLTDVAVRLAKGRRVFGTAKLARLDGSGTFKIKLRRSLKKGTYAFDVVGTDAQNRRRQAAFRLKVR